MNEVRGYKVFDPDWTCRGFQYKVGETFEENIKPKICKQGFHFCKKLLDCFNYYNFDPQNKVAEIVALGEIATDGKKSCTNKIRIERELSWYEVLDLTNIGKDNTGRDNSGDYNSGNCNSGDYNSGICNSGICNSGAFNSGNCNSGRFNSGDHNSGRHNSGYFNSGDYNSGNCNIGNCNSGDFNKGDHISGCFCTDADIKIPLFNQPSNFTYRDWRRSRARSVLWYMPFSCDYIEYRDMTKKEKTDHPEAKTTGGYLKQPTAEDRQNWWDTLSEDDKAVVKSLPNFDADIFKEITDIDVH